MLKLRTMKVLAIILGVYGLLCLPGLFIPAYGSSTFLGRLVVTPLFSVYLLDAIGIPGLLGQRCGMVFCDPTALGWIVTWLFPLVVAWLVAWAIASATRRSTKH